MINATVSDKNRQCHNVADALICRLRSIRNFSKSQGSINGCPKGVLGTKHNRDAKNSKNPKNPKLQTPKPKCFEHHQRSIIC